VTKSTPLNNLGELDTLYSLVVNQRRWLRENVESKALLADELANLTLTGDYLSKITQHRDAIAALLEELEAEETSNAN